MSRRLQILFLLLLATLPVCLVTKEFSMQHGFLDVPLFGKQFLPRAVPEVRRIDPPTRSKHGYDGQFYAQIALSPSLNDPDLPNAFNVRYRARRIGLPVLAYVFGLGQPAWILQAYALLNVAFWLVLLGALARFAGFAGFRERLLAISLLWTTGTLISVERALTDLPAVAVGVWSVVLAETQIVSAVGLLALTALFKETSLLSFPALAWVDRQHPPRRLAWVVPLLLLPVSLWFLYVRLHTPEATTGMQLFRLPGVAWWEKMSTVFSRLPNVSTELLPPLSIAIQVAYLMARPRLASDWWRWGIGWAVLALIVGKPIWIEQWGYCRILLPLTVTFNVLLFQHERGRAYACWLVLGNAAMFGCAWKGAPLWLLMSWPALECCNHWLKSRHLIAGFASPQVTRSVSEGVRFPTP